MKKFNISCLSLAGGRSLRMGIDKSILSLNKKPLITHSIHILKKLFEDIIIVVKNKEQIKKLKKIEKNVKIISDLKKHYSPIIGIKEGIKHAKYDYIFVLACDMPFIQEKTILKIISKVKKDIDCIVYAWSKEKYEPLCAIYKKSVFYNFDENICLHNLITSIKNKILIPVNEQTKAFFNINTRNDLNLANKIFIKNLRP